MKQKICAYLFLLIPWLGSSCGGSGPTPPPADVDWTQLPYDVPAGATLNGVLQDVSSLSGVSFVLDPNLQAKLDQDPIVLPLLLGLQVGQVLTLLQDMMPSDFSYLYERQSPKLIVLIPRFQQSADLSAADPIDIVEFDIPGEGLASLVSEASSDEIVCEEPEDI